MIELKITFKQCLYLFVYTKIFSKSTDKKAYTLRYERKSY